MAPTEPDTRIPLMATTTITDLPRSRALDYKAMSAIRGAGAGDWVFSAFLPYRPPVAPIVPVVNFYQTNYIADNLTLQTENINVNNSAAGASINVGATQNALTVNLLPVPPQP
jgi:hypothetical protein